MNKQVVTVPSADIRKLARQALQGYWRIAILAVLLLEIVVRVPALILAVLFPSGALGMVLNVYGLLVGAPLTLGITMIYLNIMRRKQANPIEIFNGFEYMLKAIALQIVVTVFIILWSCLLIIPGIIATYRYSLAFYILADDPSKGVMQCINESKYLTMENKGKIFCLEFSFIGWSFLCALPIFIFTIVFMFNQAYSLIGTGMSQTELTLAVQQMPGFKIGTTIASFGYLFLFPYMNVANACLYDLINGNLTIRRVPQNDGQPMNTQNAAGTPVSLNKNDIPHNLSQPPVGSAETPSAGQTSVENTGTPSAEQTSVENTGTPSAEQTSAENTGIPSSRQSASGTGGVSSTSADQDKE